MGLKIYLNLNKKNNEFKVAIGVKWLNINIFSKKFKYNDENKKKIDKKPIKKENKKVDENKEKSTKEKLKDFIQLYPLIKSNIIPIFDFIMICIDSIKLQRFDTDIQIGLSSFSDTATVTGYIWAFSSLLNLSNQFNLTAEPIFTRESIDFESQIIFKIKLLKPFLGVLNLFKRKTMIKLLWNLRALI